MKLEFYAQIPGREEFALSNVLKAYTSVNDWDRVRVAVAYASVAGLMHLLDVIGASKHPGFSSQWLIGLDDHLTQPGVLRACHTLDNAQLRVAQLLPNGYRFHPKLYMVTKGEARGFTCVGSSNLTLGGMRRNCEAFGALAAEVPAEIDSLGRGWDSLWSLGTEVSEEEIDAYESEYHVRRATPTDGDVEPEAMESTGDSKKESPILKSDSPATDPSLARTCWIEVGKNTAMGRELEFKAEQALFFGLSPYGGDAQTRQFIVSSGQTIPLRLKYQENSMWRLQMKNDIPEVARGLRPRDKTTRQLGRSRYVAVFDRGADRNTFFLRFIPDNSAEYVELRRKSAKSSGRTTARRYGWC